MAKSVFASKFRWLAALPLVALVAVMAGLAVTTLANADARHGGAREHLFDLYQRLFPAKISAASSFHVVEIDQESIEKVGPWPWPRSLIAELVAASSNAGAKGVLYIDGVDRPDHLDALLARNPCVKFHNNERGYVRCEVTPEEWRTDFRTVPDIARRDGPLLTRASFRVAAGQPRLQRI